MQQRAINGTTAHELPLFEISKSGGVEGGMAPTALSAAALTFASCRPNLLVSIVRPQLYLLTLRVHCGDNLVKTSDFEIFVTMQFIGVYCPSATFLTSL